MGGSQGLARGFISIGTKGGLEAVQKNPQEVLIAIGLANYFFKELLDTNVEPGYSGDGPKI